MGCSNTLSGIVIDCSSSKGGIKRVALFPYSYFGNVATIDDETGAVTIADDAYTYCKPYTFKKNTGSMTSTATIDATSGNNYWTTELSLQFAKMESAKRVEIQALATGEVGAIVNDSNGKWWFLGHDEPVEATASTAQTGQAKSDGNFYNITLTDESNELPFEVTGAGITYIMEKLF